MADNGRWFKLWCSSVFDQELDNLTIDDFGRWCKLGAYIKEHGSNGKIKLKSPSKTLCSSLQVLSLDDLITKLKNIPNISVTKLDVNETRLCVSYTIEYDNWRKYQENLSTDRVKKFRQNETPKKRREEKRIRREKEEEIIPLNPPTLPEWIPLETWTTFLEMRKGIKKPMKEAAIKLAIKKLCELREEGEDVQKVLEQSIMNSWQSLFAVKKDRKQWEDKYL